MAALMLFVEQGAKIIGKRVAKLSGIYWFA